MAVRTLCSVLEEMRRCDKTKNYSRLEDLIEEVQFLGNRMEISISHKYDLKYYTEEIKNMRKEAKKLEKEIKKLKKKKERLQDEDKRSPCECKGTAAS